MIEPLAADRFQAFSTQHLLLVALCVVGLVVAVVLGRRLVGAAATTELRVRRGLALVILAWTLPLQVLQLLPSDFGLGTSLPLQICDLSWMLAAFALWTRHPGACALLYFWATTLVTQAIMTPSLQQAFPDPRWWMFWGMHFATVWAVALLLALGERPTWRGYRVAVGVTLVWVAAMMTFNAAVGTNYGYLNRKPAVSSPLDLLGPWPGYVVAEIVILAAVWALLTLPWVLRRRDSSNRPRRAASYGEHEAVRREDQQGYQPRS